MTKSKKNTEDITDLEITSSLFEYPSYKSRSEMINNMDGYHKEILNTAKKKHIIDNKADYAVLVVGTKGSGKTSWAIQTCLYWDKSFTVKKNLIYYPKELDTKINNIGIGGAILLDEGILQMYSANATTKENKRFRQRFNIFRARHHLMVVCIPKLAEAQDAMVKDMNAVVFIDKRKTKGRKRVWRWYTNKQINKVYRKVKKEGWPQDAAFDSVMSYRYGHFDSRIPFSKEYADIKDRGVKDFSGEQKEKEIDIMKDKKIRDKVLQWAYHNLGVPQKKLAEEAGKTQPYISQIVNQADCDKNIHK